MPSIYKYYCAIYRSSIFKDTFKFIPDGSDTVIQFIAEPTAYAVAEKIRTVAVEGHGARIANSINMLIDEPHVIITVRSKIRDIEEAITYFEDQHAVAILAFSAQYTPDLFERPLYVGPLYKSDVIWINTWIKRIEHKIFSIEDQTRIFSNISSLDSDIQDRLKLISPIYALSAALEPSFQKFLYLWIILEIYPMMGDSEKKQNHAIHVSKYIAGITNLKTDDVHELLCIQDLYNKRNHAVHAGVFDFTNSQRAEAVNLLETIVDTIIRDIVGLAYNNSLDEYLDKNYGLSNKLFGTNTETNKESVK